MPAKLISIIGPVAAGKTTLAERLAQQLDATVLYEDFGGNPFLAESYTGRDDLLLPSQLYFLMSRCKQLAEACWPDEGIVITDYGFCQDRIFAEAKLNADDLAIYDYVSARMAEAVHPPDVLIHIDASLRTLVERIARRGRDYEAAFSVDFVSHLQEANRLVPTPDGCVRINVDSEQLDLLEQPVREELIAQMREVLL